MSIINEALKKTEESIQKNSLKGTVAPNKETKHPTFFFYILVFVVGLLLSSLVFRIMSNRIKPVHSAQAPQISSPQSLPEPAPEAPPKEQAEPRKKFILNGIFFSDNDGYALVNNQIVREGDFVDGAKVEKIVVNSVELNNEGEVITLNTNK